jgi:hypothetical protein
MPFSRSTLSNVLYDLELLGGLLVPSDIEIRDPAAPVALLERRVPLPTIFS